MVGWLDVVQFIQQCDGKGCFAIGCVVALGFVLSTAMNESINVLNELEESDIFRFLLLLIWVFSLPKPKAGINLWLGVVGCWGLLVAFKCHPSTIMALDATVFMTFGASRDQRFPEK